MQDQEQTQARPFQVGDAVVSVRYGQGVVKRIYDDKEESWNLEVLFDCGRVAYYDELGSYGDTPSTYDIQHAEPEPLMNELDDLLIQRQSDGRLFAGYCFGVFQDDAGGWFYEIKLNGSHYVFGPSLSFLGKDKQGYKVVEITQK